MLIFRKPVCSNQCHAHGNADGGPDPLAGEGPAHLETDNGGLGDGLVAVPAEGRLQALEGGLVEGAADGIETGVEPGGVVSGEHGRVEDDLTGPVQCPPDERGQVAPVQDPFPPELVGRVVAQRDEAVEARDQPPDSSLSAESSPPIAHSPTSQSSVISGLSSASSFQIDL